MASTSPATPPPGPTYGWGRYGLATVLLVAGVLSQYVLPPALVLPGWAGFAEGLALTYGVGGVAFYLLVGRRPLANYVRHNREGLKESVRWYGILGVLSLFVVLVLTALYSALDPRFSELVNRSTSVSQAGASDPLFYMLFSVAVGLIEEGLFRGWLFGGALTLDGTGRWKTHALWTTLVFTLVHVYYAQTYLEVSPLYYVQIFLLGLGFAIAYYRSGGNVLMIAALHALFDITSFAYFISVPLSEGLRFGFLAAAAIFALVLAAMGPPSPRPLRGRTQGPRGSPSWPGSLAPLGFTPRPCPSCGLLVTGDHRGFPTHCPNCGADLGVPLPWEAPSGPPGPTVNAGPPASGPLPLVASAQPSHRPLAPGEWPPA